VNALRKVREASDRLCSKRLKPFIGEIVMVMRRHGELDISAKLEANLCRVSPSTIVRILQPWRRLVERRPLSNTRQSNPLKSSIPLRTFADWTEDGPGFIEVDLVAHCGESTEGFYLNTVCAVDVASGWSKCMGAWGKGQQRVGNAIHRIRHRLPFTLLGLDSGNGSEFINHHLYDYCYKQGITFTRYRSYKKNDSCHVEQKNGSVLRRLIGYNRYNSHAALNGLNCLYDVLRLDINFFQPTMKLVAKTRQGARVHKMYDTARTPYERLLDSGVLTPAKQSELAAIYHGLNPVLLLDQINDHLEHLLKLA